VVENAFGLMKENWREMLNKSTLDVAFVPDVVHACCILQNLTMQKDSLDIDALLHCMRQQVAQELRIREASDWRWIAEEEDDYNERLRQGKIHNLRDDLVYYLAVQPRKAKASHFHSIKETEVKVSSLRTCRASFVMSVSF
jgi:hypothetical protein